jgi:hypothetical protein
MVEVLSNWPTYVPDDRHLAWRGATFLFGEDGELEHEHRTPGVLTYSATPSRPLSFLQPRIGNKALNPLGLADPTKAKQTAEAEEAMGFLKDQLEKAGEAKEAAAAAAKAEAEAKVKAFAEAKKAEEEQRVSEREAALRRMAEAGAEAAPALTAEEEEEKAKELKDLLMNKVNPTWLSKK